MSCNHSASVRTEYDFAHCHTEQEAIAVLVRDPATLFSLPDQFHTESMLRFITIHFCICGFQDFYIEQLDHSKLSKRLHYFIIIHFPTLIKETNSRYIDSTMLNIVSYIDRGILRGMNMSFLTEQERATLLCGQECKCFDNNKVFVCDYNFAELTEYPAPEQLLENIFLAVPFINSGVCLTKDLIHILVVMGLNMSREDAEFMFTK